MSQTIITEKVTSLSSLTEAVRRVQKAAGPNKEFWFRGHSSSNWGLTPSVHRRFTPEGETQLFRKFQVHARGRHSQCPPVNDYGSWLALMQHYGLPTRLLDWSRSLHVAAYFAIEHEQRASDAAIWMLSPTQLNLLVAGEEGLYILNGEACPKVSNLLKSIDNDSVPSLAETLAAVSEEVDIRVLVQAGAFTIHGSDRPLETTGFAHQFLFKFEIPANCRDEFSADLFNTGARRSLVFPDLTNLAIELANNPRSGCKRKPSVTKPEQFEHLAGRWISDESDEVKSLFQSWPESMNLLRRGDDDFSTPRNQ